MVASSVSALNLFEVYTCALNYIVMSRDWAQALVPEPPGGISIT